MKFIFTAAVALAMVFLSTSALSCDRNSQQAQTDVNTQSQQSAATNMMGTGQGPSHMMGSGMGSGQGAMMNQLNATCPMVIKGADVKVADTDSGVALTFTTKGGDVSSLRARVRHMAQMYDMHRGHGGMMWHRMAGPGMGGKNAHMGMGNMGMHGSMPAAKSIVSDVDNGARIELQPTDQSQLESLRKNARWHQKRMSSGYCWMPQKQAAAGGAKDSSGKPEK